MIILKILGVIIMATIISLLITPILMLLVDFVVVPYAKWWENILDKVENAVDKRRD